MAAEYDFSKATRGATAKRYTSGSNIVVLEPDVAAVFRNASTVNSILRLVARLAAATPAPQRNRSKARPRKR